MQDTIKKERQEDEEEEKRAKEKERGGRKQSQAEKYQTEASPVLGKNEGTNEETEVQMDYSLGPRLCSWTLNPQRIQEPMTLHITLCCPYISF